MQVQSQQGGAGAGAGAAVGADAGSGARKRQALMRLKRKKQYETQLGQLQVRRRAPYSVRMCLRVREYARVRARVCLFLFVCCVVLCARARVWVHGRVSAAFRF
jgi:hypothetical protein